MMRYALKTLLLFSLAWLAGVCAYAAELSPPAPCRGIDESAALGVSEVVELALCGNPQTREVWASARYQEAQLAIARAAYRPSVNASASVSRAITDREGSVSPVDSKSASLTLSYLLYDFGARGATLENSRQLLAAAIATRDSTVQTLFLSAVQAFYQVQAAEATLASAKQAERSSLESLKAATLRYTVGSGAPADKLQAQTAYSQASYTRIQAEGTLRSAQGNLANVLGWDANHPVNLVASSTIELPADFERDIAELIVDARVRRPDLLAAQAQVKAAEANVDAVRAADMPTLTLGSSASNSRSDVLTAANTYNLSLSLNVPLYSGGAATNRIYAAQAQVDSKLAQRDKLQRQIALDVWNAYQNLQTATQSMRSSADLVNSAEQSERVASGRYQAGVGSLLDVLVAQSSLSSARQQRVQASYNWNIYRATLAQATGNLDATLLSSNSAEKSAEKSQP